MQPTSSQQQNQLQHIYVIYATQTGTSYDLAKQFCLTQGHRFNIKKMIDMQSVNGFSSEESDCLWIFFISTTGQGEFPYSMRSLWKKMLSKSFSSLDWMNFSIYAFGDRSYGDNFCLAARKFRQRLIGLRATQVLQIGLGDQQEANGYLQEYRDKWFPGLIAFLNSQKGKGIIKNENFSQKLSIAYQNKLPKASQQKSAPNELHNKDCYNIKFISKEQICTNKGRRTFIIDMQLPPECPQIATGDILSIYPKNNPNDVKWLLKYFSLSEQQQLTENNISKNEEFKSLKSFQSLSSPSPTPTSTTITYFKLFQEYLNISSTLNHSFFIRRPDIKDLSEYCDSTLFKEKLIELQQDYDQYHNYIKKYKRNVIQVLTDFEIKLPVDEFVKRCTGIIARKYSISKVWSHNGNQRIRVLYRLVESKINQNRIHKGLCSHDMTFWFESTRRCKILKGQFNYDKRQQNNLIMISLGTGIAPFCQFFDLALQDKQTTWNLMVFYTNRFQNQIYFTNHLQKLTASDQLNPYLSLTGQGGKRITRLVENNTKEISQFVQKHKPNYKIMVCGPKEVCEGIQNILSRDLNLDFKQLRKNKTFLYENW